MAGTNGTSTGTPDDASTSRVKKILHITDQHAKILGYRVLNSQLSLYIGILQLIVCIWALTQHFYSIFVYKRILFCDFENTTQTNESQLLVGVDAIIFDVGLFHSLWGIHGCVAQHLDGGYGRFAWCICHTLVLLICLPLAFVNRPRPYMMWPLLVQQSAYGIGLLILSLAALPRVLPTFMGDLNNAPILGILFYLIGASLNYSLLYVYYHWYWHVEREYESAMKLTANRTTEEVITDPRRRPFHYDRYTDKPFIHGDAIKPMGVVPMPASARTTLQVYSNGVVKQTPMMVQKPQQLLLGAGGAGASGSDAETAYTSDDSAATTALATATCCHYYDHVNQMRAATASPFASTAAARYNKFMHASAPVTYRKASLTPGGAPLTAGRIVGPSMSMMASPMYSHHRNNGPISVSCTNSPKWSRHGTPIIDQMPNTII